MSAKEIWDAAAAAAAVAAEAEDKRLPPENSRGFDVGFAWVVIKPAKGEFVTWAKAQGLGEVRSYGGGGFQIWYSKFDKTATQSVSVHYAAARAFADVLKAHGINALADQRLD